MYITGCMHANFKTNTIQNTVIKDIMLIRKTVGLQYSTFVVVIKGMRANFKTNTIQTQ